MSAVWITKRLVALAVGSVVGGLPPKELERVGALLSGDVPKKGAKS